MPRLSGDLAESGLLDPAASLLLADAAKRAAMTDPAAGAARSAAESDLTRVLAAIFRPRPTATSSLDDLDPMDATLVQELAAATRRVELARRFHNDGVAAARELRRRRLVPVVPPGRAYPAGRRPSSWTTPPPRGLSRH